jgi:hypothetical protein
MPGAVRGFEDPLARAMLPVILHRVANATQHLNGLAALLAVDAGALATRGDDLAETGDLVDDAGWLLGLLASSAGSRLLLSRRERRGLRPLVTCVRECLRRAGRDLADPTEEVPDLAPGVRDGWQLPWVIATLLFEAGCARPPGDALRWEIRASAGGTIVLCAGRLEDLVRTRALLARELPELELLADPRSGGGEVALGIPSAWLPAAAPR